LHPATRTHAKKDPINIIIITKSDTMMKKTTTIPFFLSMGAALTTDAFVIVGPRGTCGIGRSSSSSSSTHLFLAAVGDGGTVEGEDVLARIQREYRELQERLLRDLVVTHDYEDAGRLEEQLVEKAAEAAAVRRAQLLRKLSDAEGELQRAVSGKLHARILREAVREEAAQAERDRNWRLVADDHELERDAEIAEYRSEYHAELAEQKERSAVRLLRKLQDYESRLQQALQDMRALHKSGGSMSLQERIQVVSAQHEDLLDKIKAVIDSDIAGQNRQQVADSIKEHWKEEELHKQEFEHALDTDPDLADVVRHKKKPARPDYMEREAHKHDSLLNEIQHSIDTDPDLTDVVGKQQTIKKDYLEKEARKHDSLLDEIQHSINNDPDLTVP
jgi:hypothetical protein